MLSMAAAAPLSSGNLQARAETNIILRIGEGVELSDGVATYIASTTRTNAVSKGPDDPIYTTFAFQEGGWPKMGKGEHKLPPLGKAKYKLQRGSKKGKEVDGDRRQIVLRAAFPGDVKATVSTQ